ncbi:MAG: cytochrome c biogenesis protein CcsA [Gemmatimonadales bacterium]|jgi:ABC-type uncharacterized transport system permease subunit
MHGFAYAFAAVLYLAASARYALRFAKGHARTTAAVAVLAYLGLACHLAGVGFYWAQYGEPPLVGLGPSLASIALLIAFALAGLVLSTSARALGLLLAPMAAFLLIVATLVGIEPAGSEMAFRGRWLVFHISLSFLGYAGWVVAAAAALMYLAQFRQLKHKRLGAVFEFFPPLDTLDKLAEWSLVTGFVALTLGISVGWAWTIRFEGGFRWSDPKVVWGVLAWLALLFALWARFGGRRTSRQAAMWNVAGFGMISLVYFVAKLFMPGSGLFL